MENNTIPQLRFPEFDKIWEGKKIEEIAKVSSGGTPSRSNPSYWNGNIPWITTSLINFVEIQVAEEYITEEGLKKSSAKLFPKGTILMAMYGQGKTRGKVGVLGLDATTNQACAALQIDKDMSINFVFNYLAKDYEKIRSIANDGGQQNLSAGLIKSLKISHPTLPEQTKIANFLTTVDKRINLLQKKKDELEQYKKGIMQKLFSQAIRFKKEDDTDFPDWVEKKLGEACSFEQGVQVDIELQKNEPSDNWIRFLRIENYTQKSNDFRYIPIELSKGKKIRSNEIAIVRYGATAGFISRGLDGVLANNLFKIIPKNKDLTNEFLFIILTDYKSFKYFQSAMAGGAMPALSFGIVSNLKISYPSLHEQQKIASFLSSIDKKIEKTEQQIKSSQQWKQGLLQKMFV